MDSSDRRWPKSNRNSSSNKVLTICAAVAIVAAGCGVIETDDASQELDCQAEAMPGDFLRQSGGVLDTGDLVADLDGLEGGYFSYWTEVVEETPFDPPMNVVCQALRFESEEAAASVAERPGEDPASLSRILSGWPDRELAINEAVVEGAPETQAFTATARDSGDFGVGIVIRRDGDTLFAVMGGGHSSAPPIDDLLPLLGSFVPVR